MAFISSKKSFLKAAATGDMEELEYCLAYKIPAYFSIDSRDGDGNTALHLAAINGQAEALKKLIDARAGLDIPNAGGRTALICAVNEGKTAAARLLIAAGADVNAHNPEYVTPILTAARYGQLDVVKDLAAAHADLNAVSRETGRTGLHWAVENGHAPVIEFLLTQNQRTDIVDRKGQTPADIARAKDLPYILKLLEAAEKPAAPAPAAVAAPEGDSWTLMGPARVAQIGSYPAAGRRITEIFNFESRERVIITENLKTGAETTTQPEKFEALAEAVVKQAEEQWKALGGALPDKSQKRSFNL